MATGEEIKNVYDMMKKICNETSKLVNVINDMFVNEGFEAVGDGSVMWNKSNHYLYPTYWLPYFLQRVFIKNPNINKGVGVNIIFDGSNDGLENKIPFLTCGIVEYPEEKVTKGNALYLAGWTDHELIQKEFKGNLCSSTFTDGVTATTYFLPLEVLSNMENVIKYVITPLVLMYDGEFNQVDISINEVAIDINQIIGKVHS